MQRITVETIVNAPLEQVWAAYTTPADIMRWNAASPDWHTPAATVDLRVGGQFSWRMEAKDGSVGFDFAGTYTAVVKPQRLAYSFGERTADIDFAPTAGGIRVRVSFDAESTHSLEQQQAGWQSILDNFKRHTESTRAH